MIKKIEHTAIMVKDMEKALHFYCDVLGFSTRFHNKGDERELAFIYLQSDPTVEIELIYNRNKPFHYKKDSIVNHLAFRVVNIEGTLEHLRTNGYTITPEEITKSVQGHRMTFFHGPNEEYLQLIESDA